MTDKESPTISAPPAGTSPLSATPDEISRFISAVAKNHICPVCESNDWAVVNDADYSIALTALPLDAKNTRQSVFPVVALVCNTCGYVRPHAIGVIGKWLKNNPA